MQVTPKALVKFQKASNAQRGYKKRNRKPRRVASQQKNSLANGFSRRRDGQDTCQNGPDTRRPSKGEGKTHQKAAEDARLSAQVSKMDVAIQPPRHGRPQKKNDGDGIEMNSFQRGASHSRPQIQDQAGGYQGHPNHKSNTQ